MAAAGLVALAACGNKNGGSTTAGAAEDAEPTGTKVTLCQKTYEPDSMITADFYYPENAGVQELNVFGDYIARKTLGDSAENYKVMIYLQESSSYEHNKKSNAESYAETFKEFKLKDYDAYSYERTGELKMYVLLEKISETTLRYAEIEISQLMSNSDGPGGKDFYEQNEEVKSIVNSFKYNGMSKKDVEIP